MIASSDRAVNGRPPITMLAILIVAGLLGNYLNVPLFFGADFLFGSIAVLLVLHFYGIGWGIVAALIAHSYTYFLWGHPYGIVNFTSEALFVGCLMKRWRRNLILVDGLFWLLVGIPLAFIEHGVVMQMGYVTTAFIMLKQSVNGVFNALFASLILCYLPLERLFHRSRPSPKISLHESLFNLSAMMILVPALLLTVVQVRHEKERMEAGAIGELQSQSAELQSNVRVWYRLHMRAVQNLALLAGRSPMTPSAQLRHDTEILKWQFQDFATMHVENREGRSIAFEPPTNENGDRTLALSFSDAPWFRKVKATRQPVVSDVFVGNKALLAPIVTLCAPVIKENRWQGCATGALDLARVGEILRSYGSQKLSGLTLTDAQNRVIASSVPARSPMQLWDRKSTGVFRPVNGSTYLWHPGGNRKLPSMTFWRQSFYVQESLIGPGLPWKLTAEDPVAPVQRLLYAIYVKNLAIMACLIALSMLLSFVFSRAISRPLAKLANVTAGWPEKLTDAQDIDWPATSTDEVSSLITNFVSMTKALETTFNHLRAKSEELGRANLELHQEIRDRRQAEEALRESEERYRLLAENASDVIWATDMALNFTYVSPSIERLQGWTPEEVKGLRLEQRMPSRSVEILKRVLKEEVAREAYSETDPSRARTMEVEVYRKDGSTIWTEIAARFLRDDRAALRGVMGVSREITQRKQAEEALRESEEKYRKIFENASEGIFQATVEGRYLSVNPAFARMFGFSSTQEMIESVTDIDRQLYVNPQDRQCMIRMLRESGRVEDYEVEVYRRDKSRFWISINAHIVRDAAGRLLYFEGMNIDMSERKNLEAQLIHAQKMEAVGTLAGGVAHDFNNLLTVIMGFANLLQIGIGKDDRLRPYADQIIASSEKAANLTQGLLAFSRKQHIILEPHNLNDIVRSTARLLKRLLPEDIELRVNLVDVGIIVNLDVTQMDQVLMNLATNARDAMPHGGSLSIETQVATLDDGFRKIHGFGWPGRYGLLSVLDSGTGMDEKTRERIFDPFFTTKEVGKGTGLGLASVYGIVKQHEGYITVSSEPGHGTVFRIYLPLSEATEQQQAVPTQEARGGTESILIAEDDPDVRKMMSHILVSHGYTTIEAVDGEEAIRVYSENRDRIDLVILDVVMPRKNGKEVHDELTRIDAHVRVIFVSGYTRDVVIDKGIHREAVDFVQKPLSLSTFVTKVREVLDR